MITINTYNSAMQEALVDCYETCLNALGWGYCPNTRHSDMVNIENVYMKNGCFWCLFDDEKLIGMVAIRCLDKARKIAELKRMFIFPGYQGKGYGNMLLKHSLNYAKSQGFRIVRLDTTKDRLAAVHLYEKYGFHRTEAYNDNIYAELYFELDLVDYRTEEYQ